MASKINMAIIGATSATGMNIAHKMAEFYDLLLIDLKEEELNVLTNRLLHDHSAATVERLDCCVEASWQADVIVITAWAEQLSDIAEKIREVTIRKPVIHFTSVEADAGHLQNFLPHANVIDVVLGHAAQEVVMQQDAWIQGNDEEALKLARDIFSKSFSNVEEQLLTNKKN